MQTHTLLHTKLGRCYLLLLLLTSSGSVRLLLLLLLHSKFSSAHAKSAARGRLKQSAYYHGPNFEHRDRQLEYAILVLERKQVDRWRFREFSGQIVVAWLCVRVNLGVLSKVMNVASYP